MNPILRCLNLSVHQALRAGLGVSLLQPAAAGMPILANRVGGIPEAVRDGANGLLAPPDDAPELAAAIGRLLANPEERRRLGQQGQALMAAEFSVARMVEGNLGGVSGVPWCSPMPKTQALDRKRHSCPAAVQSREIAGA